MRGVEGVREDQRSVKSEPKDPGMHTDRAPAAVPLSLTHRDGGSSRGGESIERLRGSAEM